MPLPHQRSLRLGLVCAVLVMLAVPTGISAATTQQAPTKELLEAFPLNPTGERIVSAASPSARPGIFRPPVGRTSVTIVPEARAAAGGASAVVLAAAVGGSLFALIGIAIVVWAVLRSRSGPEDPSAYVSAVFVGDKRLPVIEGSAPSRRRVVSTRDLVPALVGCAGALVVALLVVHYVG